MGHAQLHNSINVAHASHSFVQGINSLVNHRHKNPIGDKTGIIVNFDGYLTEVLRQLDDLLGYLITGSIASYHFHEWHDRYRVHKMHAYYLARSSCRSSDLSNGNGRSIAR